MTTLLQCTLYIFDPCSLSQSYQAQAPSLLDLVFDDTGSNMANLPPADYLPALERQRELEAQLLAQQVKSTLRTLLYSVGTVVTYTLASLLMFTFRSN